MKKKMFISIFILAVGVAGAFAAWSGNNNTYACPGTSVTIKFNSNMSVDIKVEESRWTYAGTYRVSGDRLTITFKTTKDSAFSSISGVTWLFRIVNDETLLLQDGSTYVRI
ncbi:MAG: hypothetical protein FWG13_05275 [Leptospirales bacterium]|nr:hypothetical protein [Leptospirales bacterium]